MTCSALTGEGIAEIRAALEQYRTMLGSDGTIVRLRAEQNRHWLKSELADALIERLRADPRVAGAIGRLEEEVAAGRRTPLSAAREILAALGLPDRPEKG
jgi:LAO/AO transport system kinase